MHFPLCGIPVRAEPHVVVVAMAYAILFSASSYYLLLPSYDHSEVNPVPGATATTTCGLAIRSYIHIFGGLRAPTAIALAVVLTWYALDTASWVLPLADSGVRLYLHGVVMGGRTTFASRSREELEEALPSPASVLMCATPGVLAISILVGEVVLWWRVCAVWKGNRAVVGLCAVSLFLTTVFVGVTMGRLEIMKSPPTRLAVMFFLEPDGIGTAVSVFFSGLVVGVLLDMKTRTRRFFGKMHTSPSRKGRKITTRLRRLADLALWALVAGTAVGAFWVIAAAYRNRIWQTLRNDAPSWSFWNFALFVATASCLRVPALVWLLPQSFKSTGAAGAGASLDARAPSSLRGLWPEGPGDPDDMPGDGLSHPHLEMQEYAGRPSYSELVFVYDSESDAESIP
ncbi:hypothetical protein GSI_11359 [Ganoderma sinense ZZ0214-1]|uniref:Uncharacterized protein n=1 Tax=Ganoderma sinense ZZ0214-1 TaxID=1077348 RepID=A0A2G8RVS0_9APHY|nr:hypothetical protein GSI_11359 [Ganoderma sinense ZZ0214-1]